MIYFHQGYIKTTLDSLKFFFYQQNSSFERYLTMERNPTHPMTHFLTALTKIPLKNSDSKNCFAKNLLVQVTKKCKNV